MRCVTVCRMDCKICEQPVETRHAIHCRKCKGCYHPACIGLPPKSTTLSVPYMCTSCILGSVGQDSMYLQELVQDCDSNPILNKLKENSRAAYFYGLERVHKFVADPRCKVDQARIYGEGPGQKVDAGAVAVLVSGYLAKKQMAPGTILVQLVALTQFWKPNSIVLESVDIFKRTVDDLRKQQRARGGQPKRKDPIHFRMFAELIYFLTGLLSICSGLKYFTIIRDRAVYCMAFFLFLRRSEVLNLKNRNVKLLNLVDATDSKEVRTVLKVTIERQKTDPGPVDMFISDKLSCGIPVVKWIAAYMDNRISDEPDAQFFQQTSTGPEDGYGFKQASSLNTIFEKRLTDWLHYAPQYSRKNISFHSMRKGGMNRLLEQCHDVEIVAGHGRWKSVETIRRHYQKSQVSFRLKATRYM